MRCQHQGIRMFVCRVVIHSSGDRLLCHESPRLHVHDRGDTRRQHHVVLALLQLLEGNQPKRLNLGHVFGLVLLPGNIIP